MSNIKEGKERKGATTNSVYQRSHRNASNSNIKSRLFWRRLQPLHACKERISQDTGSNYATRRYHELYNRLIHVEFGEENATASFKNRLALFGLQPPTRTPSLVESQVALTIWLKQDFRETGETLFSIDQAPAIYQTWVDANKSPPQPAALAQWSLTQWHTLDENDRDFFRDRTATLQNGDIHTLLDCVIACMRIPWCKEELKLCQGSPGIAQMQADAAKQQQTEGFGTFQLSFRPKKVQEEPAPIEEDSMQLYGQIERVQEQPEITDEYLKQLEEELAAEKQTGATQKEQREDPWTAFYYDLA
ncbi:hypothetical protein PRZ48_008108 [Zasmidium cellare]|uniref:Uncharacterized protein n=1 Tax=Zasmidium cellare TaxID=395010 RepID=A0ABR0EEL4_ZASCE|nr:hypothetical protein PRZ48_008108 [Zasmidium cellare]